MPAATNDNTQIQAGTGDTLRTDAATQKDVDGSIVKTPVVKLATGAAHEVARLVDDGNPLPTHDKAVWLLLVEIRDVLREILAELRGGRRR